MNVAVIGGAGYIGSHVTRALEDAGHQVTVYDNLSTGSISLVGNSEFIEADVADRDKLGRVLRRVEAVIHLAAHAYVHESIINPQKYFHNNVSKGLILLDECLRCGITRFVFSSSCAIYGIPTRIPISENQIRNPINPYGVSKLVLEQALESYSSAYGLKFVSLRYFNAAGAHENREIGELHFPQTHIIPSALAAAQGTRPPLDLYGDDHETADGTSIRDYVHVNDLAQAHLSALTYLTLGGESISLNLGTGTGTSIYEIFTMIKTTTGLTVPYRIKPKNAGDPPILVADSTRAHNLLEWQTKYSLEDMITSVWLWTQGSIFAAQRDKILSS